MNPPTLVETSKNKSKPKKDEFILHHPAFSEGTIVVKKQCICVPQGSSHVFKPQLFHLESENNIYLIALL